MSPSSAATEPSASASKPAASGGAGAGVLPSAAATLSTQSSVAAANSGGHTSPGTGEFATMGEAGRDAAVAGASVAAALPCDVASVVADNCATCHGQQPIGGAPMSLVTQADFSRQIMSIRTTPGQRAEVAALVKKRINDESMPMPPGQLLPEAQRAVLNAWLDMGHPAATAEAAAQCAKPSTPGDSEPRSSTTTRVNDAGATCYEFRNHGEPEPGDTTPYTVGPGEQYVSFYFKAPWQDASEIVSFNTLYDNRKILHHWLLYTTLGSDMDGTFAPGIGTHLGDSAQLLAGWAVGGNDVELPSDVALRLPPPGSGVMIEWHYYNSGGQVEMDNSAVEVCVAPAGTRKHTAGMTWLGTENLNGPLGMPAKSVSEYGGTCLPGRAGMNATDPIHIFILWPHMHTYGRAMRSVVTRAADGSQEEVFNKPFDFNYQITYDTDIDLYPGDMITSTCTYENTSNAGVPFGPSTDQEMCYQFAYSYPAGALENGVISLVGATNTCW